MFLRDKRRWPGTTPTYLSFDEDVDNRIVLVLAVHVRTASLPKYLAEPNHYIRVSACVILTIRDGRPSIELVSTMALLSGYFTF